MNLRVSLLALLSLALWAGSQVAYAGATWSNVEVKIVSPCAASEPGCGPNGFVEVQFDADASGGASCGNTMPSWAVIDITTPAGQALFKVIQDARISGMSLTVYGTGSCDLYPIIETLGTLNE